MGVLMEGLKISAIGLSVVFSSLGILSLVIWAIGKALGREEVAPPRKGEEVVAAAVAAVLASLPKEDRQNWLRNSLSRRRRR
ncbi:MAG: OadG family protein [Thermoplasmata archaeon]|nr:OadG family protein [Thermoplasmata archaeon]